MRGLDLCNNFDWKIVENNNNKNTRRQQHAGSNKIQKHE